MRLCVCHVNLAKGYRGGERQTQFLIEECLKAETIRVVAVVLKNSTFAKRLKSIPNLTLIEITSRLDGHFACLLRGCNVIHAHDAKAAHWAFIHYAIKRTPYLITRRVMHDLKTNMFTKLTYKYASETVGNCKWIVESLKNYGSERVSLIPSTSPFKIEKQFPRPKTNQIRLVQAGALVDHHKGQSTTIRALATLPKNFTLDIVGDGPDQQMLEDLVEELGVSQQVTFYPWIEDLSYIAGSYDLFLMPSNHEGAGSILIDIMRCKVPIISSNIGGIPDLIEDGVTGNLIRPGDSQSLATRINDYTVQHQQFIVLAENAYLKSQSYTPKHMFHAYEKLYISIAPCREKK